MCHNLNRFSIKSVLIIYRRSICISPSSNTYQYDVLQQDFYTRSERNGQDKAKESTHCPADKYHNKYGDRTQLC
jgi:hypothetical protein